MSKLSFRVQELLNQLVDNGTEVGLQVAAYVDGKLAVDACAGVLEKNSARPVKSDSLFLTCSTSKGFVATCLHLLAERGAVEYNTPIARYWPEFGAYGKEEITLRDLLTHHSGVPQMPEAVDFALLCDWDAMCDAIATALPLHAPGERYIYHAWTFGFIIGEIVRRMDGRTIRDFARDELCQPLGIKDFYFGVPESVDSRVAVLSDEMPPRATVNAETSTPEELLAERITPARITSATAFNRDDMRRAILPGAGVIMSAHAIARHYAMLGNGGELDGVRLLSQTRIREITAGQNMRYNDPPGTRFISLGYMLGGRLDEGGVESMGQTGSEFGHPGYGGSIGFADPNRRLAFGLTKNSFNESDTVFRVAGLLRDLLDHENFS